MSKFIDLCENYKIFVCDYLSEYIEYSKYVLLKRCDAHHIDECYRCEYLRGWVPVESDDDMLRLYRKIIIPFASDMYDYRDENIKV